MAVRAFVEPIVGQASRLSRAGGTPAPLCSKSLVQFFTPSYSLYPVLADIHGAAGNAVPLSEDFAIPSPGRSEARAAMGFPGGSQLSSLLRTRPAVAATAPRSWKSFAAPRRASCCWMRPTWISPGKTPWPRAEIPACAGRADLLQGLFPLLPARRLLRRPSGTHHRPSQNPRQLQRQRPGPSRGAAPPLATCPTTGPTSAEIIATRERLSRELDALGFRVFPSQTNFLLVRPPAFSARIWLQKLRDRRILVRWFNDPLVRDYLRITIGTPQEARALVKAAKAIL